MTETLATIILAAGKGTRMKSSRAKVLHEVFYQPMLHHLLNAVAPMEPDREIVIVGHQREAVENCLRDYPVTCVEQVEQRGTGHAVLAAQEPLRSFTGQVMILNGDSPLLLTEHLDQMYRQHLASGARVTIMTTCLDNPSNYGRVISDSSDSVLEIIEEKDATPEQRKLREINAGIYCVESGLLFELLQELTPDNAQNELYLTDIVGISVRRGITVHKYTHPHPDQVLGVNSRLELALAHQEIQARRNRELMASGITMHDPATISVAPSVDISPGCELTRQITITGDATVGPGCIIEPGVVISGGTIGCKVHIGANSVLSNCRIEDGTRLEPLTRIGD